MEQDEPLVALDAGTSLKGALLEFRFQLHTQTIGDSVDKSIVGRHTANIMDCSIVKAHVLQAVDIGRHNILRRVRELKRVVQHLTVGGLQFQLSRVAGQLLAKMFLP